MPKTKIIQLKHMFLYRVPQNNILQQNGLASGKQSHDAAVLNSGSISAPGTFGNICRYFQLL